MRGSRCRRASCAAAGFASEGVRGEVATLPFGNKRVARRHHAAARHRGARRGSGNAGRITCVE